VKLFHVVSLVAVCGSPVFATSASAQDVETGWSGEGALNAGFTTGNTKTRDAGVRVNAAHKEEVWSQLMEFGADYGDTGGVESKNRLAAAGQIDRGFGERMNGYVRATWERDEFSGFENRYFAGLGIGAKVIDANQTTWALEGGPGYKIDEARATATTPAATEETFGARAGSKFRHAFNERVSLTNDTEAVYSSTSTQLSNMVALDAGLMGNLSARVSLDVRHDTDPLLGFEPTDTATKFSLVYKFE
jgi:putative salt-induced outer membrane protein